MIELCKVSYQYDNFRLAMDLHIAAKEKVVIVGPSGAGKSTLLSLLAGFILPQQGQLKLQQKDMRQVEPGKRPISMLFQDNNLFAHLTVQQNVALGIKPSLRLSVSEKQEIDNILSKVGLAGFSERYPEQLSGGQRQRIALARCLIQHRPILLLDEPFSALDQALRFEMLSLVDNICQEFELTLLMVSHYLDDSLNYFNRALVVDKGQIVFDNSPSKLYQPEFAQIAKLLAIKSL